MPPPCTAGRHDSAGPIFSFSSWSKPFGANESQIGPAARGWSCAWLGDIARPRSSFIINRPGPDKRPVGSAPPGSRHVWATENFFHQPPR